VCDISDTGGLPRPDPNRELNNPKNQILENTLASCHYQLLCMMSQVLKHNYFVVGQNLLTSRQPSVVVTNNPAPAPQKLPASHHPAAQHPQQPPHPQQQAGMDDWQQPPTVSVLQTPAHAVTVSKPICKQLSKDLFPWLSEAEAQKNNVTMTQPAVLPQITHRSSPIKVHYHYNSRNNTIGYWHVTVICLS